MSVFPTRIRAGRACRAAALAASLAALASLAACDGDRTTAAPEAGGPPIATYKGPNVRTTPGDAQLMIRTPSAERGARGGTSVQLDAVLEKKNGKLKEKDKHIDWASLDTMTATVDSTGLVTAQDTGTVVVVASYLNDHSADSVTIDIVPVPVASVTLAGADSLSLDDTTAWTAAPLDSAGEALVGRLVEWSADAPTVASVSQAGEVIALGIGTTTITAASEGKSASRTLKVWPQPVASVEVVLGATSLPQFRRLTTLRAIVRDRRGTPLADRPVTWSSSDPTVLALRAQGDTARAVDVGTATVTASAPLSPTSTVMVSGTATITVTNPVEARALWVTRFEYTGPSSVDFAKIATIFQKAAQANFNVVYFQVRTSGDALYFSDLEPCSPRMCGKLGGARPAQDPLDVALAEAARYGIQVHAWVNALTGFISGSTTACNQFIASTPANWLKAHSEWSVSTKNFTTGVITRQVDNCVGTSEYMWVSPGVPEVRAQLAAVTADLARRYGPKGLKGIHLDRIRFPSNQVSYDPATQEAFRAATGNYPTSNAQAAWLDFRRGLVNQAVKDVAAAVRAVDPAMVISAAVFPGYKSRSGWSAQWSFTDLFQDPQAWAQAGDLDVEVPMNYPATAASTSWTVKAYCSNTDWTCVMDDHIDRIERQSGRQVYVGVGAIRGWDEMQRQIDLAHDRAATGMSVYSFSQVDNAQGNCSDCWAKLGAGPFKNKATVPAMPWK